MYSWWRFSLLRWYLMRNVSSGCRGAVCLWWWTCTPTKPAFATLQAASNNGWGGLKQLLARLCPPGLLGEEWLAGGDGDSSRGEEEDMLLSPRGPQRAAKRGVGGILQGMLRMSVQS